MRLHGLILVFLSTVAAIAQTPVILGVRNSASGALESSTHAAAPNSILSVYVTNAGMTTSTPETYPTFVTEGIQVLFNGIPAPIYALVPSVNLINVQFPSELPATGMATVTVVAPNGTSQSSTIALGPVDVGIFRIYTPTYPNTGAIQIANTMWGVMPASTAAYWNLPACTGQLTVTPCGQPATPGQNIAVYWTGGGAAAGPEGQLLPTGSVAPVDGSTLYSTVQQPTVTIGGISAKVFFTGIAPGSAGEYQINTQIPAGVQPGDQVPLVVTIGESSDTVGIAIQAP